MLDVIIPTYGRSTRLHQTLSALEKCCDADTINKVIVIENGQKFEAESICKQIKKLRIKYTHQHEKGLVNARNKGIEESNSDYLLFLDDDIELTETAIQAYNNGILKHGPNTYFSGPLIPKYETAPPEWLKEFLPWSAKEYTLGDTEKNILYPGFLGGNLCIPRQAITAAGNYEGPGAVGSNDGGVGEENRLQERLLKMGFAAIWLPDASGYHWIPEDKCDIQFSIQRSYRHGLTDAITDNTAYPLLLGAPRWIYRRLATEYLSLLKSQITRRDIKSITENRIKLSRTTGMIAGYKHGK